MVRLPWSEKVRGVLTSWPVGVVVVTVINQVTGVLGQSSLLNN